MRAQSRAKIGGGSASTSENTYLPNFFLHNGQSTGNAEVSTELQAKITAEGWQIIAEVTAEAAAEVWAECEERVTKTTNREARKMLLAEFLGSSSNPPPPGEKTLLTLTGFPTTDFPALVIVDPTLSLPVHFHQQFHFPPSSEPRIAAGNHPAASTFQYHSICGHTQTCSGFAHPGRGLSQWRLPGSFNGGHQKEPTHHCTVPKKGILSVWVQIR
ncbi:hypothetical protein R3P38DRAFT_3374756 [Favolaschia claudopus]|uniref:Uncharacterized protein n=1 Tax=Favolaschia claudopus TaxID=2862362 RepID=A0AAV9ZMF1_9AGAR